MKKVLLSLVMAIFAICALAQEPYTLKFNLYHWTSSAGDATSSYSKASKVSDIFTAETADFVASIDEATNVYAARDRISDSDATSCGIKFGASKKGGSLTITLATPTEVESIVFSAAMYGKSEGGNGFTVSNGDDEQNQSFKLSAGNKVFEDCTWTPKGTVTTITITQNTASGGRFYMNGITITPKADKTPDLGTAKVNEDNIAKGIVNLTFPECEDQTAATSANNTYKLNGTISIALEGTDIDAITSAEYAASEGFNIVSKFNEPGYYTITIPKKALQLVDASGEVIATNKKDIEFTIYVEPDWPDLKTPTIDKSKAPSDGYVYITFPEFPDQKAATSYLNTYSYSGTMSVDGGEPVAISNSQSELCANYGLVIGEFEYGKEYIVTIPRFGVRLYNGDHSEVLASNLHPITFRVSPAGESEAYFNFTAKGLMDDVVNNNYRENMEYYDTKNPESYRIDVIADGPYTNNEITVSIAKGKGSSSPLYYSYGDAIRIYSKNTITLTSSCENIKSVQLFAASGYPLTDMTPSVGTYDSKTGIWTGDAGEVVFTYSGKSQTRIYGIDVAFDECIDDAATLAAREIFRDEFDDAEDARDEMGYLMGVNVFQYAPGTLDKFDARLAELKEEVRHAHSEEAVYAVIAELRQTVRSTFPNRPGVNDMFLLKNTVAGKYLSITGNSPALVAEADATPIQFHSIALEPEIRLAEQEEFDGAEVYHSMYLYNTPERKYFGYNDGNYTLTNSQLSKWYILTGEDGYAIMFADLAKQEVYFLIKYKSDKVILISSEDVKYNDIFSWDILSYTAPETPATDSEEGDAEATAITGTSTVVAPVAVYSANGARLQSIQKGINIIKMADGTVKKVIK